MCGFYYDINHVIHSDDIQALNDEENLINELRIKTIIIYILRRYMNLYHFDRGFII